MENNIKSVLIVESHPMMNESLSAAIAAEPDFTILDSDVNGKYAFKLNISEEHDVLFLSRKPDIILFSLDNRTLKSLRTLSNLHRQLSDALILALTTAEVHGQESAALANGAHAVLTKTASRDELLGTLRSLRSETSSTYRLQYPVYPSNHYS